MIQRIQTLWLALAGVAGFMTYKLPLWKGVQANGTAQEFLGPQSLTLFALIVIAGLLAFAAIFLFKNRKLQKQLTLLAFLLAIIIVPLEYFMVESFKSAQQEKGVSFSQNYWMIGAILPILMVILLFLAYRGIRKDEKLIKSLDRLR
jgi:DMSO/TMAO reductase YedYZ heme-binding membrane subunit